MKNILAASAVAALVLTFGSIDQNAFGGDLTIAYVKRDIPLSDSEPLYVDYYIHSTGAGINLKKNQIVNVIRSTTLREPGGSQSLGNFEILIGQLKVLDIQGQIAVAREFKSTERSERPLIDQPGFLVGDKVLP